MKTAKETILEKAGELFYMAHSTTCEKIVEGMHEYSYEFYSILLYYATHF